MPKIPKLVGAVCLGGLLFFLSQPLQAEQVITLEVRPGVKTRLLVESPGNPRAVVLLFPGGHGKVNIRKDGTHGGLKGNFLIRSRRHFVANGLVTAVFDAPFDRRDKLGLSFTYRSSAEHAADITTVVKKLRGKFPRLPIWLVGTSRGSTSVANAATAGINTDGIVLTAAVGVSSSKGGNVLDFSLEKISQPALIVHHRNDGCFITPLSGAQAIQRMLVGSKQNQLLVFEGGQEESDPCKGKSHHGFLGIERPVVRAIADWIKNST